MLYVYDQRFDVTGNLENFCELNKTLVLYTCATRFDVTENLEKFLNFGSTKQGPRSVTQFSMHDDETNLTTSFG